MCRGLEGNQHSVSQCSTIISLSQSNAAFATAGSDGIVGIWDMRVGRDANNAIGASMCCSPSKGLPLTSMIEMHHDGNGNSLLAGSVDGSVAMLNYRKNLMPVFKVSPTNKESAITCVCEGMWKNEQVAFAAQENGAVSAIGHDGAIKHSFSLKQGAARLMATCNHHLIVTGDDNIARVLRPN